MLLTLEITPSISRLPRASPIFPAKEVTELISSISLGLALSTTFRRPLTIVACKLPIAPSNVAVDVAASFATSVIPKSVIAWLNSSAVI